MLKLILGRHVHYIMINFNHAFAMFSQPTVTLATTWIMQQTHVCPVQSEHIMINQVKVHAPLVQP